MSVKFLEGAALEVYNRVFNPLSDSLAAIKSSKEHYKAPPYVKLRTSHETDPSAVQLYCNIVNNNSYFSSPFKVLTGARNLFQNAINSASPNLMWNCRRTNTAQVLETATNAFSTRITDINAKFEEISDPAALKELQTELAQIQIILQSSLKTVFYVYRTYNQNPNANEQTEEIAEGDERETLRPQYQALLHLTQTDLSSLLQKIHAKLNPVESSAEQEPAEVPVLHDNEEHEVAIEDYDAAVEVMADKALVFRNQTAASKWLCRKLQSCRGSDGDDAYDNLMHSARIAKTVPQSFLSFARTLDSAFKEKMAHYEFVQEVYQRFNSLLEGKGLIAGTQAPNSFKMLLKELCEKKAGREVYQALFKALMNENGTAPYGLKYEPAVLNAIMNDPDYFPIFDAEHHI